MHRPRWVTSEEERDASSASHDAGDDGTDQPKLVTRTTEENVFEEAGGEIAAQDNTTSADATVASIDTEPKEIACWRTFDDPPGCHFFEDFCYFNLGFSSDTKLNWSWSGRCSGGVAIGEGTVSIHIHGELIETATGGFVGTGP